MQTLSHYNHAPHRLFVGWHLVQRLTSSHPHEFNALTGPTAPPRGYIIFYSNVVDGRMWCPVGQGPQL